jgi:hypothetical protein
VSITDLRDGVTRGVPGTLICLLIQGRDIDLENQFSVDSSQFSVFEKTSAADEVDDL